MIKFFNSLILDKNNYRRGQIVYNYLKIYVINAIFSKNCAKNALILCVFCIFDLYIYSLRFSGSIRKSAWFFVLDGCFL